MKTLVLLVLACLTVAAAAPGRTGVGRRPQRHLGADTPTNTDSASFEPESRIKRATKPHEGLPSPRGGKEEGEQKGVKEGKGTKGPAEGGLPHERHEKKKGEEGKIVGGEHDKKEKEMEEEEEKEGMGEGEGGKKEAEERKKRSTGAQPKPAVHPETAKKPAEGGPAKKGEEELKRGKEEKKAEPKGKEAPVDEEEKQGESMPEGEGGKKEGGDEDRRRKRAAVPKPAVAHTEPQAKNPDVAKKGGVPLKKEEEKKPAPEGAKDAKKEEEEDMDDGNDEPEDVEADGKEEPAEKKSRQKRAAKQGSPPTPLAHHTSPHAEGEEVPSKVHSPSAPASPRAEPEGMVECGPEEVGLAEEEEMEKRRNEPWSFDEEKNAAEANEEKVKGLSLEGEGEKSPTSPKEGAHRGQEKKTCCGGKHTEGEHGGHAHGKTNGVGHHEHETKGVKHLD